MGRILAAQKNAAGGSPTTGRNLETFAFDPAGNLLNPNRGGDLSSGGTSNEREQVPTNRLTVYQDLRFRYDLHGNIVERRIGWHTVQRFRYSAEHQMLESTVTRYHDRPGPKIAGSNAQQEPAATVQTTRYRYDALGRRIDKQDAFGRTTFLYDGDLLAGEVRGSRLSEYIYEPDSFVPLAKLESEWKSEENRNAQADTKTVQTSFATYYYHCDQIGAPQELTDEAGRIVWAASYKVWGQTQQLQYLRTGTDDAAVFTHDQRPLALAAQGEVQSLALVEQPLRFQGQYFDGETGLHYNRFRYYDPVVGRFVHQDPIGLFGGNNLFIYANNSLVWIDPYGLAKRSGPGIREKLYPTRIRKRRRDALEKQQKDTNGNIPCAICGCLLNTSNTSVQHDPALVQTHNTQGFDTDQKNRNDLYNTTATSLVCLPCQKSEGGTMSHTQQYRTDTGPNFKPRNSRKKKDDGCAN